MDPRIEQHAELLADYCLEVTQGDNVVVNVAEGTEALAAALCGAIAARGGQPLTIAGIEAAERRFMLGADDETVGTEPAHLRALTEAADAVVFLKGGTNTRSLADVPKERMQARSRAMQDIREERLSKRWCLTLHPTDALAQEAGMSTEAFADLVYNAVLIDWEDMGRTLDRLKDRMADVSEVRLVGEGTDLVLPIEGRTWVSSKGQRNMPSGEVFTAPIEDRVEGTAYIDLPSIVQGEEVRGLSLTFEKGEVVDWSAEAGESAVRSLLDTDAGARRLGELGIGMNRGIDRPTRLILLDEKMGGTIHLALGRAYKENKGTNGSAVHQDFIKTMGPGSRIEADGEVIQEDGVFWFEDGFNGSG